MRHNDSTPVHPRPPEDPPSVQRPSAALALRAGTAALLVAPAQFLMAHLIVQSAWNPPYSWSASNISELGLVTCGVQDSVGRYICSPLHTLMNASFVLTGLFLLTGVFLTRASWPPQRARAGGVLIAIAAAGWVVTGAFPADVNEDVHVVLGAVPIFFAGNFGLLLMGLTRPPQARWLRAGTVAAGVIGLAAAVLFLDHKYLGLGMGGMERVTALPLLLWSALTGASLLHHRRVGLPE